MNKKVSYLILGSLLSILAFSGCRSGSPMFVPKEKSAELHISIQNVRSEGGLIMLVLFDQEKRYTENKRAIVSLFRKAAKPNTDFIVRGMLNPGTYAIRVFHDENGNGKLDVSEAGTPKEGVGVSNNKGLDWSIASFKIESDKKLVPIKLAYP